MTFEQACETIRYLVETKYRVVPRYRTDQQWSFKFEHKAKQYDALDILFMHVTGESKPQPIHKQYNRIGLTIKDALAFHNLASGNWKRYPISGYYDDHKRIFESITGIEVT